MYQLFQKIFHQHEVKHEMLAYKCRSLQCFMFFGLSTIVTMENVYTRCAFNQWLSTQQFDIQGHR